MKEEKCNLCNGFNGWCSACGGYRGREPFISMTEEEKGKWLLGQSIIDKEFFGNAWDLVELFEDKKISKFQYFVWDVKYCIITFFWEVKVWLLTKLGFIKEGIK